MVRSIHVLGSHLPGGAESFFARLVQALTRAGQPTLAVIRGDSPVVQALTSDVEQVRLPMLNNYDVYSRWRLTRLVRSWRADIVQTYMSRASRLTRLPAGSHAVHVARLGGYYKIEGYYRHANAWVGNTRDICDYLVAHQLPPQQVFHIGNFVPLPRSVSQAELSALRATLKLPGNAFVLFALGRLVAAKGFQDLLEAFARLGPTVDGRPLVLVIAGDGAERDALAEATRSLGLAQRVRWVGWQNDPTPFYALGEVFVCPSRHEPLGNVILEAWQRRMPVVSTLNEGARQIAQDGHNALLAPLADPAGLAEALQRLFAMRPEERRHLADAGHATVQREHNEEAVVAAYLKMYEQLGHRA